MFSRRNRLAFAALLAAAAAGVLAWQAARAQTPPPMPPRDAGAPVLKPDALLTTPVGGLERTQATAEVVAVAGQSFAKLLRVVIRTTAPETNATQLTIPNAQPIAQGDALLASFAIRGTTENNKNPARVEFLFEKATDPWTKSVTQGVSASLDGKNWKRVLVPFTAAEAYAPGEAMASLRFAFGPQTVEVADLSLVSFGKTRSATDLRRLAAQRNPLGAATVAVKRGQTRQTLAGFGGNFCQPRYGQTEPMDSVGAYNLEHLNVVQARIGVPLEAWTPEKGVYKDEAQAHAALLQMQLMARRRIPIIASVWEGPAWMLGGQREQSGRTLPPERYADCIEAIAQFLVTARDKYQAPAAFFSFNEPDYGVNFKFTSAQMAAFIRQAGPRFRALGLSTKFLVGDTANGANFPAYVRPLLDDKAIAPFLGPLAFHCWDALSVPDARYEEIAAIGRAANKPIWCTEAGHDAQLWRQPNPWASWENAQRLALAYERTLRLTGATVMDYWTYQDNYPLVAKDSDRPYPVFFVLRQMETVLPPGAKIATATGDKDDLRVLAASGPGAKRFSLLLINPIGGGEAMITGLPPRAAVTVEWNSDGARPRTATDPRVDGGGRLRVALPARSVVTVRGTAP